MANAVGIDKTRLRKIERLRGQAIIFAFVRLIGLYSPRVSIKLERQLRRVIPLPADPSLKRPRRACIVRPITRRALGTEEGEFPILHTVSACGKAHR